MSREAGAGELSPEERQRWWREAGRSQLCELLFWRWDPIGVNRGFPATADEYDSYADPIGSLLGGGDGPEEIATHLTRIEEEEMELGRGDGTNHQCRGVALAIVDWQRNSIAHWRDL